MRIVSYNTRGSLGMDNTRDTRRIAGVVRSLMPDIVCFQEVHRGMAISARENQPLAFETLLGRRFVFQRNARYGRGAYGIGIATRGTVTFSVRAFSPGWAGAARGSRD